MGKNEKELEDNNLEQDEITDSIHRIEHKVSKINVKLHTMRMMLQDLHEERGIMQKLKRIFHINEETRMALMVAGLCGVVSASIVWLLMKLF